MATAADTSVPPPATTESIDSLKKQNQENLNQLQLLKQIEFYFGDANLPFDKFIKLQCSQNDGWFPIDTLLKFNRVKGLTEGLQSDEARLEFIKNTLKESSLIELDENGTKLRRRLDLPFPDGNSEERTVYIKGFHKTETKLDGLIEHFKKYNGFEAVVMRWYKEKVIVSTPVTESNGTKSTDNETKDESVDKKEETDNGEKSSESNAKTETDDKKETGSEKSSAESNGTSTATADKTSTSILKTEDKLIWHKKFKGSIFVVFNSIENAENFLKLDDFSYPGNSGPYLRMTQKQYKLKKKSEFEQRQAMRANPKKDTKDEPVVQEEQQQIKKDVLIKLVKIPDGYTRELIKEKWFAAIGKDDGEEKFKIAFIDFQKGDNSAILRLDNEGSASQAKELLNGVLKFTENESTELELLKPEEEVEYNKKVQEERAKLKRRGGGGGRGGRGGKRGRRY